MSATHKLSSFYGSMFKGLGRLSYSPYSAMYNHVADGISSDAMVGPIAGMLACAALTFIPVLPTLTALTMSLSIAGAILAVAAAFLLVPGALMIDGVSSCFGGNESRRGYQMS